MASSMSGNHVDTSSYLPPPQYFPLHLVQGGWTINICPVDQLCSCSTSKNSPGGSLSGFTLNDTTNQSSSSIIHLFISLCFYTFTQHILIKCTIRELIFCLLLNYPFHLGCCALYHRARPLLLFAIKKWGLNVLEMFFCCKHSWAHGTQMSHLMAWEGAKVWTDSFGFLDGALAFCS